MDDAEFAQLVRKGRLEAGDRLKQLRIARGFASATAASDAFGWVRMTYYGHESANRAMSLSDLELYPYAYDVPVSYLDGSLAGIDLNDGASSVRTADEVARFRLTAKRRLEAPDVVWVRRYDSLAELFHVGGRRRHFDPQSAFVPLTRATLNEYGLGIERELAMLRVPVLEGSFAEIVLRLRSEALKEGENILMVMRNQRGSYEATLGARIPGETDDAVLCFSVIMIMAPPELLAPVFPVVSS